MALNIVLLVLASAALHPVWNLLVKKNPDPQLGFLFLTAVIALSALVHGLIAGADFTAVFSVLPFVGLSVCGQLLYGICLTATLKRGDLSAYYPIIRASPVFVVIVGVLLLGQTYSPILLLGIALAVAGAFLLLYRRGTRFLEDPRTLVLAVLAMSGTGIYSLSDARLMESIAPQVLVFVVDGLVFPIHAILWFRRRARGLVPAVKAGDFSLTYLLLPGIICYASYYLILLAYQFGGDVAAVTSIRQASIPISVALGGLFLREGAMLRRFFAAGLLALGIIVIALYG
ncbi:DMT family transporter [Pelagibius sp. Alg239-R121]|uniref:DMT family transporter n=1 Tax=Pelagibius sp. Alg239-R121 TaxID=2993448 RepID=UPI0024A6606E|nr:DMT family transporter [Pelagibius sp. Alg239-R121]